MPNLDKTGPIGKGPTGLRRGGCEQDYDAVIFAQGRGRGYMRRRFDCPYFNERKQLSLEDEKKLLEDRLKEVQKEIEEKV